MLKEQAEYCGGQDSKEGEAWLRLEADLMPWSMFITFMTLEKWCQFFYACDLTCNTREVGFNLAAAWLKLEGACAPVGIPSWLRCHH